MEVARREKKESTSSTESNTDPPSTLYVAAYKSEGVFKDMTEEDSNDKEITPPVGKAIASVANESTISSSSKRQLKRAINEAMEPTTPKKKKEEIVDCTIGLDLHVNWSPSSGTVPTPRKPENRKKKEPTPCRKTNKVSTPLPKTSYNAGYESEDAFKNMTKEDRDDEEIPPLDVKTIATVAKKSTIASPSTKQLRRAIHEALNPRTPEKKKEEIRDYVIGLGPHANRSPSSNTLPTPRKHEKGKKKKSTPCKDTKKDSTSLPKTRYESQDAFKHLAEEDWRIGADEDSAPLPKNLYDAGYESEDAFKDMAEEDWNDEEIPSLDLKAIACVANKLTITSPSETQLERAIDEAMEPRTPTKLKEEIKDCVIGLELHTNWYPPSDAVRTPHKHKIPKRIPPKIAAERLAKLSTRNYVRRSARIVCDKTPGTTLDEALNVIEEAHVAAKKLLETPKEEEPTEDGDEELYNFSDI